MSELSDQAAISSGKQVNFGSPCPNCGSATQVMVGTVLKCVGCGRINEQG